MRKKNKRKKKNMKLSRNRAKAIAIAIFLTFAMTLSLVALPTATAQAPGTFQTYAYIGAMPNPVGVGQEVLLHVGITQQLSSFSVGWEGLTVTVTRPDGHTETLGPFRTDSTGGTGTVYVPNMAGEYTLQTHFPQQVNPATQVVFGFIPAGTIMLASDSHELTLVVQEEPLDYYPGHALPTEYWTRPIDAQLREWYTISANWLQPNYRNRWVPYNDYAPETAHILWTKPLTVGGVVGGSLGDPALGDLGYHAFEEGDAYEGKWGGRGNQPLIIGGRLYYEKYAAGDIHYETVCVDLHTGEELWSRPLENQDGVNVVQSNKGLFGPNQPLFGQLLYWDTFDYHGVYDYIWVPVGSTWYAFDPDNGDWIYTLFGIPSGTQIYGPKGEILIYNINTNGGYMTMWNSTNIPALYQTAGYASMDWGRWRPMGKVVNATGPHGVTYDPLGDGLERNPSVNWPPYDPPLLPTGLSGYQWNVSIPGSLPGRTIAVLDDRAIGGTITNTGVSLWGLNLDPEKGAIGSLLFENTWNAPVEWTEGNLTISGAAVSSYGENGVYTLWSKEERQYYGFSTDTGKYLWKTSESEYYLQIYVSTSNAIVDDKLYSTGASGVLYCYDIATGEKLWEYHAKDQYSEILWANDWWQDILFITDGKVYTGHEEHSPVDPKPRGAPFICVNATTGEEIWRADGLYRQTHWGARAVIGDSIIATMDTYDQRVYAIGKGPSKTTVSIQNDVITHGDSVLVKGMVTDTSAGTKDDSLEIRFPDGVPAVSDANMSDWMLYVYKQFERPTDVMGVEVVVSVLDPNNNVYEVGRTTSDASGMYKLMFTPEVPGEYTVIASFDGSGAYYGSYAQTAVGVEEAPATTPEPTPMPASAADLYLVPGIIGIIIAIVVVGAIIVLMLRKR